jgi:hypothetical protein
MSIWDKLKLLMELNKTLNEVMKVEKIKALMAKLDGSKTIIGLLMVVAYYAAPNFGVHLPETVLKIGSGWAAFGMAHKLDKATGILSTVLSILTATKDSINSQEKK